MWTCVPRKFTVSKAGRSAVPFDFAYDNINMNLLTNEGFSNALFHACNLEIGSGHVTAPVCSTWVFMFLDLQYKIIDSCWIHSTKLVWNKSLLKLGGTNLNPPSEKWLNRPTVAQEQRQHIAVQVSATRSTWQPGCPGGEPPDSQSSHPLNHMHSKRNLVGAWTTINEHNGVPPIISGAFKDDHSA